MSQKFPALKRLLRFFQKTSIVDVRLGYKYASVSHEISYKYLSHYKKVNISQLLSLL